MASDEIEVTVKLDAEDQAVLAETEYLWATSVMRKLQAAYDAQRPKPPELEPGRFYLATNVDDGERAVIVASTRPDHVDAVYQRSGYGANVTMPVFTNIRPLVEQTPEAAAVLARLVRLLHEGVFCFPRALREDVIAYEKSIGGAP